MKKLCAASSVAILLTLSPGVSYAIEADFEKIRSVNTVSEGDGSSYTIAGAYDIIWRRIRRVPWQDALDSVNPDWSRVGRQVSKAAVKQGTQQVYNAAVASADQAAKRMLTDEAPKVAADSRSQREFLRKMYAIAASQEFENITRQHATQAAEQESERLGQVGAAVTMAFGIVKIAEVATNRVTEHYKEEIQERYQELAQGYNGY